MSDSVQKYSASRMGSAPIGPLLLSCSVPMMISMLVQALYNIVDSIFVSRVNEAALSAVSLAFPIQNLMIAFAVGTAVGVNAYLSRCLGEGNRAEASRAAMNGLFLAFCGGIAFLVFGILGARAFIASQTTDAQIMQYGADYLSICTLWCMGLFLQCMLEKLLVATGRSAFAMASQLIGALVNIALGMWALLCTVQSAMTFEWLLPLLFGLMLLVDGVVRAQSSFALAKRKGQKWWVVLLFSIVSLLCGALLACSQLLNNRNVDLLLLSGIFLLAEGILNLCCTIYIAMEFHALDRLDAAKAEMETAAAPEPSPEAPSPAPAEPAAEESAETDLPDVPTPELTTEPPEPDQEPTADAAT